MESWLVRLWTLAVLAVLSACSDGPGTTPAAGSSSAMPAEVAGPTVRAQAITATPQIINPAEELQEFAPDGILRWTDAGAFDYQVWVYADDKLAQFVEFSSPLFPRQYQFTKLQADKTYYVKVYWRMAVDGPFQSLPAFALKTTSTVRKARLVNAQEELDALGVSGTLRWSTVPGADIYSLWIYRDSTLVAFAETSGPIPYTQFQITSLKPGVTYYAQVYARVSGQFYAGGALPITITDQQERARILNSQQELDAFAPGGLIRWSPVSGATGYQVWIYKDPNSAKPQENSVAQSARAWAPKTLEAGTSYYVQVYAFVAGGKTTVGSPYKLTTVGQASYARLTNAQEELEAFSTTGTLKWSEVPGATGYQLWIYGNAGQGSVIEFGAKDDRTYQLQKSCTGAIYYVQVYAEVGGKWITGWPMRLDVTQGQSPADCKPPFPDVTFSAGAEAVAYGASTTLSWTSKFADTCTASDGWSGEKGKSGQATVGPLGASTLFTLVCTGPGGSKLAQLFIVTQPGDPLFANQWHLQNTGQDAFSSDYPIPGNDINVASAWAAGYTGKGIKVGIVDSGLEGAHEDLAANFDLASSRNFLTNTSDPSLPASTIGRDHGTMVAGIVAAVGFNNKGGRGVAYGARLRGYNYLKAPTAGNFALSFGGAAYSADNDVFNASFGEAYSASIPEFQAVYSSVMLDTTLRRGGLGQVVVNAAGNDFDGFSLRTSAENDEFCEAARTYRVSCSDPNHDERLSGSTSIIVGATNAMGRKSSYSTTGSSLWISAPGGEYGYSSSFRSGFADPVAYAPAIVTTSRTGCANAAATAANALDSRGQHSAAPNCQYTAQMNGTSSAAPNVAGVVALMLEANPKLSARDIKDILARTARQIDPAFTPITATDVILGKTVTLEQGWVTNAAGRRFNNWYGFGVVDAGAAVSAARTYSSYLPAQKSSQLYNASLAGSTTVPGLSTVGLSKTFNVTESFAVEQAIAFISIYTTPLLGCNQIELKSPAGTKSIILHAATGLQNTSLYDGRLLSNAFYGEPSAGVWTLTIYDWCGISGDATLISALYPQRLLLTGH